MKKFFKLLRKILLVVLVIYVGLQIIPYNKNKIDNPFKIEKGEKPLVMAHGGGKELNPENTWMSFNYAMELGVDCLEMDLRMTKDGILITHHNEDIDDYTLETGLVHDYTYEELSSFNFGYYFKDLDGNYPYRELSDDELKQYDGLLIPATVEEIFQKWGDSILYCIEIKDDEELGKQAADELLRLIEKYEVEAVVCIASFHKEIADYFSSIAPDTIVTSFDLTTATDFVKANYIGYGFFTDYVHEGFQLPTEKYNIPLDLGYLIYKIHHNDMFVHYWTIDDPEEMRELIEKGCDGIITDRPDLMIQVLEEMGY